ncbi:unnamed protein product, partial [Scytosiphon promiscuus]
GSDLLTESDDPPLVRTDNDDSSASAGEEGQGPTLTIGGVGAPADARSASPDSDADEAPTAAAAGAAVDDGITAALSAAGETSTALSEGTDGASAISAGDEDVSFVPAEEGGGGGGGDGASWAAVSAGGRDSSSESLTDAEAPQAADFVDNSVLRNPDDNVDGPSAVVPANELVGDVSDLSGGGGGADDVEAHAERPHAARPDLDDDDAVEAARPIPSLTAGAAGGGVATVEAGADADTATTDAPAPLGAAEDGTRVPSSTAVADVVDAAALGAVPAGAALGAAASVPPSWVSAKASAAGVVDFFRVRRGRRSGATRRQRPGKEEEEEGEEEEGEEEGEVLAKTAATPAMGDDGTGDTPDEIETHPDVGGPADKDLASESHLDGAAGAESANAVGVLPSLISQALGSDRGVDGSSGSSGGGDGDEVRSGAVVGLESSSTRGTDAGSSEVIAAPSLWDEEDGRAGETAGEEHAGAAPTGAASSEEGAPPTEIVATVPGEAEATTLATGAPLASAGADAAAAGVGAGCSVAQESSLGQADCDGAPADSEQALADPGEDVAAAVRGAMLVEPRARGEGVDAAEEKALDVDDDVGTGVALATAAAADAGDAAVVEEDGNQQQADVAGDAEHDRMTESISRSSSGEGAGQEDGAAPAADSQPHGEADGGVEQERMPPEDGLHSGGDGGAGSGSGSDGSGGGWGEG